ncbi:MAG: lipid-binding SYLF domain-containing protein [Gammaproteobacteria bacterium]|nr:lipid-binding SYLF domain-containing protein [Gammaproteobacteria bacterium]
MTRLAPWLAAALLGAVGVGAQAATELDYRVDTATQILNDLQRIPENAVPPALLSRAYAVAVIPSVIKGGFIVGGTYGKGIVVARRADGNWSNPAFVQLTQGSLGFQAGVQSTDLILVFKSQRALDGLSRGKITLGGDASVAAGPVGRQATASTDLQMQSEIYSYARSRGFFAGVSLQGGMLSMDRKANGAYYQGEMNAGRILTDTTIPAPVTARRFIDTLAGLAPAAPRQDTTRAAARDPEMDAPAPEGATTFGINDAGTPAVDGTL